MNEEEKYSVIVRYNLTEREILEQLAEECAELSKAALKVIRAGGMSNNPTTTGYEDAIANLNEEAADIIMVLHLLRIDTEHLVDNNPKWERWAKRLTEGIN